MHVDEKGAAINFWTESQCQVKFWIDPNENQRRDQNANNNYLKLDFFGVLIAQCRCWILFKICISSSFSKIYSQVLLQIVSAKFIHTYQTKLLCVLVSQTKILPFHDALWLAVPCRLKLIRQIHFLRKNQPLWSKWTLKTKFWSTLRKKTWGIIKVKSFECWYSQN